MLPICWRPNSEKSLWMTLQETPTLSRGHLNKQVSQSCLNTVQFDGINTKRIHNVLMSAKAVQYEFIWLQQAPVNQPKGGVDMTFMWNNPHSCMTAAICMQSPSLITQHSEPSFWLPLLPQWKRQDKSISQDYNLRHFLACRVINRLIFFSLLCNVREWDSEEMESETAQYCRAI